ncbi:MAG: histidine--tRNA ligase [Acidimicrobiia bacterium]|nr:histidine--tRNA ligase [Acidimicrobiia bacterium]
MAAGRSFRAPKGTRDLLVPESTRARRLVEVFADLAERSGFGLVVTPMFEELDVFLRLGEATDVVTKEMYTFETKGGDRLALRPELTASLVRAFVQHNPPTPWKAWCAGFNFRYERPQKGRYRQFEQVDVELIGTADPQADVEVVALGWRFYEALGLRRVALKLNDLGDRADRPRYLDALRAHFAGNLDALSEQSRLTLEKNPLRVLDSKRPEDADLVAAAPVIGDYVSDESAAAFVEVQVGLRALDVPFTVTPRLVRGLDYYTRTTFEFAGVGLGASQDAVGGGGRYDGLVEDLGGPATPGIGFGLGVDRTLLACDEEGVFPAPAPAVDVFVVDVVDGSHATVLCDELRRSGLGADRAYEGRSMKAQMKKAGASGAPLAVIVGPDEDADGTVAVRDLRTAEQSTVARGDVVESIRKLLS